MVNFRSEAFISCFYLPRLQLCCNRGRIDDNPLIDALDLAISLLHKKFEAGQVLHPRLEVHILRSSSQSELTRCMT